MVRGATYEIEAGMHKGRQHRKSRSNMHGRPICPGAKQVYAHAPHAAGRKERGDPRPHDHLSEG